ncbi:response regulator [Legionella jamestowniensis]|uniref:response regulator n=1 Tax=Legionella jamestowniensis TaxID=455 RepID=UPI0008EA5430|nr:response regulator [Legionella jamestowniensis]SFM08440.1 Response regulator receiver domain-containing protein [Legionella jamestowniensis DSM 19215]
MFVSEKMELNFYHPTNIIFFDDNREFLDAIKLHFEDRYNLYTCTNYRDVESLLDRQAEFSEKLHLPKCTEDLFDGSSCENINIIIDYLFNKERFNRISVLVIDYKMPEINGINFCESIKGRNIFKILLTAEADKDTAISSFNAGLIDKFILKTSKNLHEELADAINELNERYFLKFNYLNVQNQNNSFTPIKKSLECLFKEALNYSNAIEYYKIDNSGSYLMLDSEGYPTWFVVKAIAEINQQLELLEGYEGSYDLVKFISNKQKMLFIPTESDYKLCIRKWDRYLISSNQINDTHYYAMFKGHFTDQIEWGKIVSFSEYQCKKN